MNWQYAAPEQRNRECIELATQFTVERIVVTRREIFNFGEIGRKCRVDPLQDIISAEIFCCNTRKVNIYRRHLAQRGINRYVHIDSLIHSRFTRRPYGHAFARPLNSSPVVRASERESLNLNSIAHYFNERRKRRN